ncbi:MAG TPA: hypothetical protein VKI43_10095, partial [Vicinamibacterales bacterium]|nr:hypothetical protein [Vicinamibacterales bacterium]
MQTLVSCSIAAQHDDLSAEARGAKADDVSHVQSSTTTWGWLQAHAANGRRCSHRRAAIGNGTC